MVIDIVLIALALIAAAYGYKKGCIKIVSSIISFIIAGILAYMLAKTVGGIIANSTMGKSIKEGITSSMTGYIDDEKSIPEGTTAVITEIEKGLGQKITSGKDAIISKVTNYVFTGLGFITVFLLVRIILWIASIMLSGIFELPILKSFNKLGGIIASVALTLLKVWIALAIINFVAPMGFMNGVINLMNQSVIAKTLYDHNILVVLITKKLV